MRWPTTLRKWMSSKHENKKNDNKKTDCSRKNKSNLIVKIYQKNKEHMEYDNLGMDAIETKASLILGYIQDIIRGNK